MLILPDLKLQVNRTCSLPDRDVSSLAPVRCTRFDQVVPYFPLTIALHDYNDRFPNHPSFNRSRKIPAARRNASHVPSDEERSYKIFKTRSNERAETE